MNHKNPARPRRSRMWRRNVRRLSQGQREHEREKRFINALLRTPPYFRPKGFIIHGGIVTRDLGNMFRFDKTWQPR